MLGNGFPIGAIGIGQNNLFRQPAVTVCAGAEQLHKAKLRHLFKQLRIHASGHDSSFRKVFWICIRKGRDKHDIRIQLFETFNGFLCMTAADDDFHAHSLFSFYHLNERLLPSAGGFFSISSIHGP